MQGKGHRRLSQKEMREGLAAQATEKHNAAGEMALETTLPCARLESASRFPQLRRAKGLRYISNVSTG